MTRHTHGYETAEKCKEEFPEELKSRVNCLEEHANLNDQEILKEECGEPQTQECSDQATYFIKSSRNDIGIINCLEDQEEQGKSTIESFDTEVFLNCAEKEGVDQGSAIKSACEQEIKINYGEDGTIKDSSFWNDSDLKKGEDGNPISQYEVLAKSCQDKYHAKDTSTNSSIPPTDEKKDVYELCSKEVSKSFQGDKNVGINPLYDVKYHECLRDNGMETVSAIGSHHTQPPYIPPELRGNETKIIDKRHNIDPVVAGFIGVAAVSACVGACVLGKGNIRKTPEGASFMDGKTRGAVNNLMDRFKPSSYTEVVQEGDGIELGKV